jgi:zinc protease
MKGRPSAEGAAFRRPRGLLVDGARRAVLLLLIGGLPRLAAASDEAPFIRKAPSYLVKAIDLPTGMRIIVEVDRDRPIVGVAAVVDCGSAQDPSGKEGLAHLVEHLTFRGKPDSAASLSTQFEFAGAGIWNALTQHDLTTYFEIGPRESLAELVRLEGARLSEPLKGVDADVFETEREVVRNELAQDDENGKVTAAQMMLGADLYPPNHPYSRPIIGTTPSLYGLQLADAEGFVRQCYQPHNYTLLVSGDFDPASIGKVLQDNLPQVFFAPPAGGAIGVKSRLDRDVPDPPKPPSNEGVHWVKATANRPALYIAWSLPRAFDQDAYVQSFLANAVDAIASENIGKEILSVDTVLDRGKLGSTLYLIAKLRTGEDAKGSAGSLLHSVGKLWHLSGPWFKKRVSYAFVGLARSMDTFRSRLVERAQLTHLTADPLAYRRQLAELGKVERGQVEKQSYAWLGSDRARVVFLKPDEWEPPERSVGGSPHVFSPAENVRLKLAPEALRTYVHPPTAEVKSVILDNGLELVLVHRPGVMASVTVAVRSGSMTATPPGVVSLAGVLARAKRSSFDEGAMGISSNAKTSLDASYYLVLATSGNVENALELTAQRFTTIYATDHVPEAWNSEFLPLLKEEEQKSSFRAAQGLLDTVFSEAGYPRRPTLADYQKLMPHDVDEWIARTYQPANAVAVIVSDLELDELEKLARNDFGAWKSSAATASAPSTPPASSPGPVRIFRVDRPASKQTEILIGCAAPPRDARDAIAFELLSARLKGRLRSFARERYGGSYGVESGTTIGRQFGRVVVWGLFDDRSLNRVLALARKELEELASLKLTDEDLQALKWHRGIERTVADEGNAELGADLAEVRAANLPIDLVTKFPEHLETVTAEDVARAAATCRNTVTLGLVGDPAVIDKALAATGQQTQTIARP